MQLVGYREVENNFSKENDFTSKIRSRLEILEKAVLYLNLSSKNNEKEIFDIKESIVQVKENLKERLTQNEERMEFLEKKQSDQWTGINNEIRKEREDTHPVQEIDGTFEDKYELPAAYDLTLSENAVRLLQSTSTGVSHYLESANRKCKELDNDANLMTPSIQSQSSSCHFVLSSAEIANHEQSSKMESLHTKVKALQDQIELLKTKIDIFSAMQGSVKPSFGFFASNFSLKQTLDYLSQCAAYNGRNDKDTELVLTGFHNAYSNFRCDYNPHTGIFKVGQDGLYLVHAVIKDVSEKTKQLFIGLVIRKDNTIVYLYKYKAVNVLQHQASFLSLAYLKSGNEICIFQHGVYN